MSWKYLIVLGALAIGFVIASWLGATRISTSAKRLVAASGANAGLVGDILRNAERVVCNGAIDFEIDSVETALSARTLASHRMSRSLVVLSGMQYAIIAGGMFVLLSIAGAELATDQITIGDFVLLQAYGLNLALPMATIGFILSQSAAAVVNIAQVMAVQPPSSPATPSSGIKAPCKAARVEIRDLSFAYSSHPSVVQSLSIDFPAGSYSAIVGRNGSGKSTLSKLIAGRLNPGLGTITYNDLALTDVPPALRHQWVLYVPQRSGVLNRSLRANLTYPPSGPDETGALERLNRWDFFETDRIIDLDLEVGEGGAQLSGGQLQKMELARVAGIDVPCLVLDESTSALDPASEQQALFDLRRLRGVATTIIVVTHRLEVASAVNSPAILTP